MVCTGQSCIAAKRFIVAERLALPFAQKLAARMLSLKAGDPLDGATQLGPLSSEQILQELLGQLDDSVAAGARVLAGGRRLERRGFYLEPSVVVDVTPAMRLAREEVFGPIAPILAVSGDDEALRVANASEFGLGGSVWTADAQRGERVARRIEAGTVFVNSIVKSDPRMPFGGVKRSGIGRELSWQGLREFVNVKGISVYAAES
jgi:succinate-semialdehyde dehydrogenase/glutarate-semialdehyde dehydrogenase